MTKYRGDMVDEVAKESKQTKRIIEKVIEEYTQYIYTKTEKKETVNFLQLFKLEQKENKTRGETRGYISEEIGRKVGVTGRVIKKILEVYEACICEELLKGEVISIYGIAQLRNEQGALRIRKSGRLANQGYRVKAKKWIRKQVKDFDRQNT